MTEEEEDQVIHNGELIFNLLVKVVAKVDRNIDIMVEVQSEEDIKG